MICIRWSDGEITVPSIHKAKEVMTVLAPFIGYGRFTLWHVRRNRVMGWICPTGYAAWKMPDSHSQDVYVDYAFRSVMANDLFDNV